AIFRFAACGVIFVGGQRYDASAGTIGDNKASVGSLGVGLGLDNHPAWCRPSASAIPESVEEPLRFFGRFELRDSLIDQGFADSLEDRVGADAEGVIEAEALAHRVHPRHAAAGIAANMDVHARPGSAQSMHEILEISVGAKGRVHRTGTQG